MINEFSKNDENKKRISRRRFIKTAGAAGLIGCAEMAPNTDAAAAPAGFTLFNNYYQAQPRLTIPWALTAQTGNIQSLNVSAWIPSSAKAIKALMTWNLLSSNYAGTFHGIGMHTFFDNAGITICESWTLSVWEPLAVAPINTIISQQSCLLTFPVVNGLIYCKAGTSDEEPHTLNAFRVFGYYD